MISSSTSIIKIVKSIHKLDCSIFDNPLVFEGYVKDLYLGNNSVIDDFVIVLRSLNDNIIDHSVNSNLIYSVCNRLKNPKCIAVQSRLFDIIYVSKKYQAIDTLDSEIKKAYVYNRSYNEETNSDVKAKKIVDFRASYDSEVRYGKIVHLSWVCNNPFQLILSNENENMDVTSISSIELSVTSEVYSLLLYDSTGKIIDRSEVKIQYRKNSFCIFCGTPIYDVSDIYCTHCGLKL